MNTAPPWVMINTCISFSVLGQMIIELAHGNEK